MIHPVDAANAADVARGQEWANLMCLLVWLKVKGWIK